MGQAVIDSTGGVFSNLSGLTGQYLESCRQKPLFVFQSGKLNRLPRDERKVVFSSPGMAFSVVSGTWSWDSGSPINYSSPDLVAGFQILHCGVDRCGKVLRFHERTNFDVGVFDHRVRAFLHPVNRFLQ
jgi:hypothetical protein